MAEINCVNNIKTDAALKLYYRYEETSGTSVSDSSGNGSTGTASRTNILNNSGGQFGNRAVFASASSDKITVVDATILKPTGVFSVGTWLKTTTTPGTSGDLIHSFSQNTNLAGIKLNQESSNKIRLWSAKNTGTLQGTDYQFVESTGTVNDGNWHFIVGTADGSNLRIYIDAVLQTTTAWANSPAYAATNYVRVGCGSTTGTDINLFDGSLDDSFLLNGRVLSLADIQRLYSGDCDLDDTSCYFM